MKKIKTKTMLLLSLFHLCTMLAFAGGNAGDAKLAIEAFEIKADEEAEMLISMSNSDDDITLVQFDLSLPEGLTIKKTDGEYDIDIAGRTTWKNHSLEANEVGSAVRFLLVSTKNSLISGTSGAIISVKLQASSTFAGGNVTLKDILLVNPDGVTESKPSDFTYTIAESAADIIASGVDGNITWSLSKDGVLTLSGHGDMNNYYNDDLSLHDNPNLHIYNKVPWIAYKESIRSIIIKDGVTSIGSCAFSSTTSLTSIRIPNTVTSIGEFAFFHCKSLASIDISNSVDNIGKYAFAYCCSLTSIVIPNSITSINEGVFHGCSELMSVAIPNTVTNIGEDAFGFCSGLTSIIIPNSVKTIGRVAFADCSLISVSIPNSVKVIGRGAFMGNVNLSSVTIPNSVECIGKRAFFCCFSIDSVVSYIENPYKLAHDDQVFDSDTKATLYVPKDTKPLYQSTEGWDVFPYIVEMSGESNINGVHNDERNNGVYYDLQGHQVGKPTVSGIYIVNGKKVYVK